MEMETTQIKGVDSTKRVHAGRPGGTARTLIITEKIMTHGQQARGDELRRRPRRR